MNIQQHLTILGAIFIAMSVLGALVGVIVFISVVGGGLMSGDAEAAAITSGIGFVIGFFFLLFSAPGIIGGIGLLKRKSWSRILVLILSALSLLSIPVGTVIGIYGLWVLTRPEAQQVLRG